MTEGKIKRINFHILIEEKRCVDLLVFSPHPIKLVK